MKKIVVKFGGSVMRSPESVDKLNLALNSYKNPVVVVVSAFFGITDKLSRILDLSVLNALSIQKLINDIQTSHFDLIDNLIMDNGVKAGVKSEVSAIFKDLRDHLTGLLLIGDIPASSSAYVLSFGEKLSSIVLSSVLKKNGKKLTHIDPEGAGLFAQGPMLNASIDFRRSEPALIRSLSGNKDYIIPGFYGISDMERIALFGRGGSDYSAAGIAACIGAESCDLWKDVDGFMTADPAVIENALKIPLLSYGEAAELSYFGAGITHPETFGPLKIKNIPLKIYNTVQLDSSRGLPLPSTIISSSSIKSKDVIKSISGSTGFAVLRIKGSGVGIHPGIISTISNRFSREEINIRSIITSQTTINFLLSVENIEEGRKIVHNLHLQDAEEISTDKDISLIAAVGEGFRETYGVAARMLTVLSEKKINVSLVTAGASDEAIYFTIKKDECDNAVRYLHKEFFERKLHI